ncbi:NYN domain-containing protein [Thermococcus sp.]|uniref:NYN domain-containing protein n=1 Tax=Thermococcus sp. TaxID=35749 RepID=UPI0019CCF33E|nr:NYN domain-containing protein [Thermococcus sp.]MBC7094451.1 NYN domain-containing protein [Thermococcus sp.]
MERKIGLVINAPNILLERHLIELTDVLGVLRGFGRIVVGKVVLNHNASPRLVEAVVEHGLEPIPVLGRTDVAVTIEAMKIIWNSDIDILVLGVRDAHFMPLLFEAKSAGKDVVIIALGEKISDALQNTADRIIKLPLISNSQLQFSTPPKKLKLGQMGD